MTDALTLVPKRITLRSEAKFFYLERGSSEGTAVEVEFDVPEALRGNLPEFRREIFREKRRLDLMALNMEYMRGSCPTAVFTDRQKFLQNSYAKALNETHDDEPVQS